MKYAKKCESCGHMVVAYTQPLNKGMVKALRKLTNYWENTGEAVKKGKLDLTRNEYNNFNTLKYYELAEQKDRKHWNPTEHGLNFIYGIDSVIIPAGQMGSVVLRPDHPAWDTFKSERWEAKVQDIDEDSYKQREEYREEKTVHNLFD